jgi:hypothetical protein
MTIKGVPLTAREVAAQLGVTMGGLIVLQNRGYLVPDLRLENRDRLYEQSTVDRFYREHRSKLATLDEVAEAFAESAHIVRHHMRRNLKVKHDAYRGRYKTYKAEKVIMLGRARGWLEVLSHQVRGETRLWLVKRHRDGKLLTVVGDPDRVTFVNGNPYRLVDQVAHGHGDAP